MFNNPTIRQVIFSGALFMNALTMGATQVQAAEVEAANRAASMSDQELMRLSIQEKRNIIFGRMYKTGWLPALPHWKARINGYNESELNEALKSTWELTGPP